MKTTFVTSQLDGTFVRGKEVDDCDNEQRYEKIFDEKTMNQFLVLMAIFYDSSRDIRIQGDNFCAVAKDLLASVRNVLAIKEKCGETITGTCNGCGDGDTTSGSYMIRQEDVMVVDGKNEFFGM